MVLKTVDLYEYFGKEKREGEGGILTVYCRERMGDLGEKIRPAVLVVPGGGYSMCSEREREPVALRFLAEGYAAFTLVYTVNAPYPVPLIEGAMALIYIRENAQKYGIDPARVAAVGFSAGGHLVGMLGELFGEDVLSREFGKRAGLVRPDAVLLSYPVVTLGIGTHGGTAQVITGGDAGLRRALSLETRVTAESAPAFIWHTGEDDCVPVENAVLLAEAYRRAKVPFELHIFEKGWHGTSLADRETSGSEEDLAKIAHLGAWFPLALQWLRLRGFTVRLS